MRILSSGKYFFTQIPIVETNSMKNCIEKAILLYLEASYFNKVNQTSKIEREHPAVRFFFHFTSLSHSVS